LKTTHSPAEPEMKCGMGFDRWQRVLMSSFTA